MRTLSGPFLAAIHSEVHELCRLVKIIRRDGVVYTFTDATREVYFNSELYRSDIGFSISGLLIGTNLNSMQGFELSVPMREDVVNKMDILKRRFYGARVEVWQCALTSPPTAEKLYNGMVGNITFLEIGSAQFAITPGISQQTAIANAVYSQTCRHNLGDSGCRYPIENLRTEFTVTALLGTSEFVVNNYANFTLGSEAETDYYQQGQLMWTSGGNAGWALDIAKSSMDEKSIMLMYSPPEPIAVGDTGYMYPGCTRYLSVCHSRFNNVANFGGTPFATGWV